MVPWKYMSSKTEENTPCIPCITTVSVPWLWQQKVSQKHWWSKSSGIFHSAIYDALSDSRRNVGSTWWWCWYDGRKWSHFIDRPVDWGVAVEQVWHRDRVSFDFDGHWLQVSLMVKDICLPCVLVKNNNTKMSWSWGWNQGVKTPTDYTNTEWERERESTTHDTHSTLMLTHQNI